MIRTCKWCGQKYDDEKESSIWCEKNPHRGRGANRRKPRIFTMLMLPSTMETPMRSNRSKRKKRRRAEAEAYAASARFWRKPGSVVAFAPPKRKRERR